MKPRSWILACILILCGLLLRADGLGTKAYGNDEATTSLRVAGGTLAEYQKLFDTQSRTVAQLRLYQERLPQTSLADVQRSLASEDPQHPPLYYDLERMWTTWDHGVLGHRRLSVFFGTMLIPAMGWLVFEVSGSIFAALVVMGLVAVSPFFVLYSQQAREYALWALWTALSSALLLYLLRSSRLGACRTVAHMANTRPSASPLFPDLVDSSLLCAAFLRSSLLELRKNSRCYPYGLQSDRLLVRVGWIGYALLLLCGLLTDILFFGVSIAHLFVVLRAQAYKTGRMLYGILALVGSVGCFAVLWMPAMLANRSAITNNTFLALALPFKIFLAKWLVNISTIVVDFGLLPAGYASRSLLLVGMLLAAGAIVGCLFAGVWAWRHLQGSQRSLVFALIVIPALLLLLPDVVRHESRSTAARYLVPTWLGLEVLLATGMAAFIRRLPIAGMILLALTLSAGIVSATLRAPVPAWWTDWSAYGVVAQAAAIDRLPARAEIAYVQEEGVWDFSVMELSNRLPDWRIFRLYPHVAEFMKTKHATQYLLDPGPSTLKRLRDRGYSVQAFPLGATVLGPLLLAKNNRDDAFNPIALWHVQRMIGHQ